MAFARRKEKLNRKIMIKALAMILVVVGAIGLLTGLIGVFGSNVVALSPWALTIIGFIFFTSGIGLLKRRKDTDEVSS
jgi:hypothetical protein